MIKTHLEGSGEMASSPGRVLGPEKDARASALHVTAGQCFLALGSLSAGEVIFSQSVRGRPLNEPCRHYLSTAVLFLFFSSFFFFLLVCNRSLSGPRVSSGRIVGIHRLAGTANSAQVHSHLLGTSSG